MNATVKARSKGIILGVAVALTVVAATGVRAEIGAGSLFVASASHTPTKWNIVPGIAVNAEIRGVSTSEVGDPLPATIAVYVKSEILGNVQLVGTRIDATSNYSFTYTPPTALEGACGTTVVAYNTVGNNSNNDLIDDGVQNGSANAAAGFRFVDPTGQPIECTSGVEPRPWGGFKTLYR